MAPKHSPEEIQVDRPSVEEAVSPQPLPWLMMLVPELRPPPSCAEDIEFDVEDVSEGIDWQWKEGD